MSTGHVRERETGVTELQDAEPLLEVVHRVVARRQAVLAHCVLVADGEHAALVVRAPHDPILSRQERDDLPQQRDFATCTREA